MISCVARRYAVIAEKGVSMTLHKLLGPGAFGLNPFQYNRGPLIGPFYSALRPIVDCSSSSLCVRFPTFTKENGGPRRNRRRKGRNGNNSTEDGAKSRTYRSLMLQGNITPPNSLFSPQFFPHEVYMSSHSVK